MTARPEPNFSYPEDLPVSGKRAEIAAAIAQHQVIIVTGETGSGKTTQLPKIALELGRKAIAHTQPRRLAARAVAERIAEELGTKLGDLVGYQVRFTAVRSRSTGLKVMTDGILLTELRSDRQLRRYDTIIIDEAHERSLNIDFLLGYLKQLLPQRPELKVIITSATIDAESFAKHFGDAPILAVSGRSYPVEIRYRPAVSTSAGALQEASFDETDEAEGDDGCARPTGGARPAQRSRATEREKESQSEADAEQLPSRIEAAIRELEAEPEGDILVFFSGEGEIRDAAAALGGLPAHYQVLQLFGRLSSADQLKIFSAKPPGIRRRIVLSTNVAETSLTVPGIRYVIDTGTARISRYSPRSKLQRLPIESISKAAAQQRAGRAGRLAPGIAIRLYSEEDFDKRDDYTEPEILRTNLAAVLLKLADLGFGDITAFPFLTKPDSRGVRAGFDLLRELGAVTASQAITPLGRKLARLPIDPRFARMLLEADRRGVLREVTVIVAGLSIIDPRERPLEDAEKASQQHSRFADPNSDFLSLLALWNYLEKVQRELSGNQFRKRVRKEYLNYLRVREWRELYQQLTEQLAQLDLHVGSPAADPDSIHKSLLSGLLSHIALRDDTAKLPAGTTAKQLKRLPPVYLGVKSRRLSIFPGSVLAKKRPEAIMAAEQVETSRVFARVVAAINPAWAEELAGDLTQRSYSEPHWSSKLESSMVYEKVLLFGLPIVPRRRVRHSRIDPQHAHELFVQHALVEGDWRSTHEFQRLNAELLEELDGRNRKARLAAFSLLDDRLAEFYRERVPERIADSRTFDRWWRLEREKNPTLLTATAEALTGEDAADTELDALLFPDTVTVAGLAFPLRYNFAPGAEDDGVTVTVPLDQLPHLSAEAFAWQVPGLRHELLTTLIKGLPKQHRKHLVPAADWARRLLDALDTRVNEAAVHDRTPELIEVIRELALVNVPAAAFDFEALPAHLRPRFEVHSPEGEVLASSRSVGELTELITATAPPALVEQVLVVDTAEVEAAERIALAQRLAGAVPNPASYVAEQFSNQEKLVLATSVYSKPKELLDDLLISLALELVTQSAAGGAEVSEAGFEQLRQQLNQNLSDRMLAETAWILPALAEAKNIEKQLKSFDALSFYRAISDIQAQLATLLAPGFLAQTPISQLRRLPIYLRAIRQRLEKLPQNPQKDFLLQQDAEQAAALLSRHSHARYERLFWLIQELRVNLFAQSLGTTEPVSLTRIRKEFS